VPCGHWRARRGPALDLIRRPRPDVIALQETASDSGVDQKLSNTYAVAAYKSSKFLLYERDRFAMKRSGSIELGRKHWAVWADLADKEHDGKRVVFVSAHFGAGPDDPTGDGQRRENARRLLAGVHKINGKGRPVVYAGDFNSHKHRTYDSPTEVMNKAGYWDAYDLAEKLVRPNYNSANQLRLNPVIGDTWGDHVDHVWVRPGQSRILKWRTIADLTKKGRYADPLPSDHNPVFVKVAVD
jgi:endonuclease/exonuclease/phosphatase family metal-dependent hydrolase